jgi:hypothetical protein
MEKAMNDYTVYKHYHYSEIYHVEALNEQAAIEIVDDVEFDQDPDDIFQEFDFYSSHQK